MAVVTKIHGHICIFIEWGYVSMMYTAHDVNYVYVPEC